MNWCQISFSIKYVSYSMSLVESKMKWKRHINCVTNCNQNPSPWHQPPSNLQPYFGCSCVAKLLFDSLTWSSRPFTIVIGTPYTSHAPHLKPGNRDLSLWLFHYNQPDVICGLDYIYEKALHIFRIELSKYTIEWWLIQNVNYTLSHDYIKLNYLTQLR